jgi:NADH-quinone oxidoreductase subunit N
VFVLAVLTLLVGSVLAIVQNDVKRMLAYSSISHAGFVLVGVQAASNRGVSGALFYLLAYTFMVVGSFGVVTLVGRRGDDEHGIESYRGLATRHPVLALVFTIFLLAQAGVPFTSGFLAKFYVIGAAVDADSYALAILAMLAAAVSAYLYLRIVVAMYMTGDEEGEAVPGPRIRVPALARLSLGVALLVTILFGLVPGPAIDWADHATAEHVAQDD